MPWDATDGGYTKHTKSGKGGGFVRNPNQYEALRRKGMSKERAAAITNSHGVAKSAFGVGHSIDKGFREHVAGPMAGIADMNTHRFERKAMRKAKKGDLKGAANNRRLASMSRSEAQQFRQMKADRLNKRDPFEVSKLGPGSEFREMRNAGKAYNKLRSKGYMGTRFTAKGGNTDYGFFDMQHRRKGNPILKPKSTLVEGMYSTKTNSGVMHIQREGGGLTRGAKIGAGATGGAAVGAAGYKKIKKGAGMISAFGVDHGEISKANQKPPSAGRVALAGLAPGFHGPIAGRKGKKLRSFGNELGGSALGQAAGTAVAVASKKPSLRTLPIAGSAAGGIAGMYRNQRKGYLKREH